MPKVSRAPKSGPLVDALAADIRHGTLLPETKLLGEVDAGRTYGMSRTAVRNAYQQLAALGLVESVPGHGWYVRGDKRLRYPLLTIDQGRAQAVVDVWRTFLDSIGRDGDHVPHAPLQVRPPEKIRHLLALGPQEETVVRHRVRRVEGEPWALSTAYFPAYIARDTPLASELDMQNPSPLRWLAENEHPVARDEDLIGARMPTSDEVELLDLSPGTPMIALYRTSWDPQGRRIRCTADAMPAHRFELVVTQEH